MGLIPILLGETRIIYISEEDVRPREMMAWYYDTNENGEKVFKSQAIHGSHLQKLVEPWEIERERKRYREKIEEFRKNLQDIEDSLIVLKYQPQPLYYYGYHVGYCADEINKEVSMFERGSYKLVKILGKDGSQGRYAIALEKIAERKVISIASIPEKVSSKATIEHLFITKKRSVQINISTYERLLEQMQDIEKGTDKNKIPYQEIYDRNNKA